MEDVEPVADRFRRALAEAKHTDHRSVLHARLLAWRDDLRVVRSVKMDAQNHRRQEA
jgi:hypothetical protein